MLKRARDPQRMKDELEERFNRPEVRRKLLRDKKQSLEPEQRNKALLERPRQFERPIKSPEQAVDPNHIRVIAARNGISISAPNGSGFDQKALYLQLKRYIYGYPTE